MLVTIFGFSLIFSIFHADFGFPADNRDNLTFDQRLLIRTFRNAIGDILTPIYNRTDQRFGNIWEQELKGSHIDA